MIDGPLVEPDAIRVLFDGTLWEPRLDHPECVAVDRDRSVWCGGERGQVFRIALDDSSLEQIASSAGFTLGIAFAPSDLFVCDLKAASVLRLPAGGDRLTLLTANLGRWHVSAVELDVEGLPLPPVRRTAA